MRKGKDFLEKIIIAAVSENFVIGKDGRIPWHSNEELRHFRETTLGFPIIMGRKTWESIGKPLDERINIVLTRNKFYKSQFPQIYIFDSLQNALSYCEEKNFSKVFIIGGESIFYQSIAIADSIILSKMKMIVDGDVFFPKIEPNLWELISSKDYTDFAVHHYIRKVK